jgi:membrane fusion protein (multidrug efflux system)
MMKNIFENLSTKHLVMGAATAVVVIAAGVYLYKQSQPAATAEYLGVSVEVDVARRGSLNRKLETVGNLVANNTVSVRSQVRGQVSVARAQGGEEVQKGAVLFELDDRTFVAALKEAQARFTVAEANFKRAGALKEKNFGTGKSLDETQAQFLAAQAAVEKAQKELEDTKISAPFEGMVSLHKISVGATVDPSTEILTITDVDPMKVDFKVPAQYYAYLSVGQEVTVTVDSLPDQVFKATIENIDAQVDAVSQQVAIRATLDNSKRMLKPGSYAKIAMTVGSQDNALFVPEEAVKVTADQSYVFKVFEVPEYPGVFAAGRVPVITGIEDGDRIEIKRGLNERDLVVTVGMDKLRQGAQIRFDLNSVGLGPKKPQEAKPENPKAETKPVPAEEKKK